MWGSVYHNLGWVGIVIIPVALAATYQYVTFKAVRTPELNTIEVIGMAGTFVIFGNWVAGGPEYILNAGGVTYIVIWWFGRRSRALSSPDSLVVQPARSPVV